MRLIGKNRVRDKDVVGFFEVQARFERRVS